MVRGDEMTEDTINCDDTIVPKSTLVCGPRTGACAELAWVALADVAEFFGFSDIADPDGKTIEIGSELYNHACATGKMPIIAAGAFVS